MACAAPASRSRPSRTGSAFLRHHRLTSSKRAGMATTHRNAAATMAITVMNRITPSRPDRAVEIAPGVHWIGVLYPGLRSFDIILKTANGTTYNAYAVRGSDGVAIIDTVKECFADDFFRQLESVARYDEISAIVLNHLEPDHTGALPELLRRAPQARLYISTRAKQMLQGLLHGD